MTENGIRILDISYYMCCPPTSGGSLRILNPLLHMDKSAGITFDFVFSTWGKVYARDCEDYLKNIPVVGDAEGVVVSHYQSIDEGCPNGFSVDVWRTISKELKDRVVELVGTKKYDIVQIEHSQLSWIVPFIRDADPGIHIILDCHNIEYMIYERWIPYASKMDEGNVKSKYESLKAWEEKVWKWYDSAFSVSSIEEKILNKNGITRTFLVPTGGGIDPIKYEPKESISEKEYDILYLGTMNWFPNAQGLIWFIEDVFPLILDKRPNTILHIVGSGQLDDDLREKASKNIRIWGHQEDDVHFFHNSKVFIIPLWIGAGARVKLVTAWASRIPIVSTTLGAEGIDAVSGENILLADEPESFAGSVLSLLNNNVECKRISDNAFNTLEDKYSIDCCVEKLVHSYKTIYSEK